MFTTRLLKMLKKNIPATAVALAVTILSSPVSYAADSAIAASLGDTYTISAGYYNGKTTITVPTLASQTKVDSGKTAVTAGTMLTGCQGWVNGNKITGTMPNQGTKTATLNAGESYTIPAGYHNGSGKVTAASLASQTQANAAAAQILSGKTAWVNGSKVTSSMPNRGNKTASLNAGGSVTLDAGYYTGGTITANSLASQTQANATSSDIRSGKTAWVNGSQVTGSLVSRGAPSTILTNDNNTVTFPAGIYDSFTVSTNVAGLSNCTITYCHHKHSLSSTNEYTTSNSLNATGDELNAGYSDDYMSPSYGGCFTVPVHPGHECSGYIVYVGDGNVECNGECGMKDHSGNHDSGGGKCHNIVYDYSQVIGYTVSCGKPRGMLVRAEITY